MFSFTPTPLPPTHRHHRLFFYSSPSRHSLSYPHPCRRLRLTAQGRSTEFSFASDDHASSHNQPPSQPIDWTQWRPSAAPLNIPAFPFPPTDVFLPGELKTLHLYEARYLALFENSVIHYDKRCAHVLIDTKRNAIAAFAVLLHIHSWTRLDLGVSIQVEAIGRLKLVRMTKSAPFLRGLFQCVEDKVLEPDSLETARQLEKRFWKAFREVVSISLKLDRDPIREKTDKSSSVPEKQPPGSARITGVASKNPLFSLSVNAKKEFYEQKLKQAARRAAGLKDIDFGDTVDDRMVGIRAAALSFAGWEFFPSTTPSRQRAIEQQDTVTRLRNVCEALEKYTSKLAAQLALQNALAE